MTKQYLYNNLVNLDKRIRELEKIHEVVVDVRDYLSIDQAKKRDYIVRNKYLGKITHKQIKDDFKKEIEKVCGDNFDSITNKLLNYEFYFENKNILELFSEILKKYEYKQIVLDTYGDKKNEK